MTTPERNLRPGEANESYPTPAHFEGLTAEELEPPGVHPNALGYDDHRDPHGCMEMIGKALSSKIGAFLLAMMSNTKGCA